MSRRRTLPHSIVPFTNADKSEEERWTKKRARDIANFPNPSRILLVGPPGLGKSTLIKNILIRQAPPFDEAYVVHEDAEGTQEYEDLEPTEMMGDIPDLEWFNELPTHDEDGNTIKRCMILDDLEFTSAHKERLKNLATLLRYASTHKGFTVYLAHQDMFSLPTIARKMCNVFCVRRPRARQEVTLIENRCGLAKGDLKALFDTCCREPRDCLVIDHTLRSPAPLRKNVWEVIPETLHEA